MNGQDNNMSPTEPPASSKGLTDEPPPPIWPEASRLHAFLFLGGKRIQDHSSIRNFEGNDERSC